MYTSFERINYVAVFLISAITIYFYFPFSAEDAYIVGRYAYNFGTYGELAYNIEEPISALTSPLHAIIVGVLFSIFRYDPVVTWKFFSVFLLLITVLTLLRLLTSNSQKIFFLVGVLLSSSILLWTVGGLETPLLMFLVSLSAYIFLKDDITERKTLLKLGTLFGLMFITRFDAAIFMLSMSLYIVWINRNRYKNLFMFIFLAIVIISIWFLFSKLYYGHFMPTSFFAKKPGLSWMAFFTTFRGLFWTSVIPIVIYVFYKNKTIKTVNIKNTIVYISLFLVILYMFTMANKHMMFSFRPFIPYLPIAFILLILIKKEISKLVIELLFVFQLSQLYITYAHGINYPISEIIKNKLIADKYQKYFYHEYALLNIPIYIEFMNILEKQGGEISLDWKKHHKDRKAIVFSYAEGIASYSGIDEYFVGDLVAKGACKKPDYIMGLHFLDKNADWAGISSKNSFLQDKLNFYIGGWYGENIEFSVSRVSDLNKKDKMALDKMVNNCKKTKIW